MRKFLALSHFSIAANMTVQKRRDVDISVSFILPASTGLVDDDAWNRYFLINGLLVYLIILNSSK